MMDKKIISSGDIFKHLMGLLGKTEIEITDTDLIKLIIDKNKNKIIIEFDVLTKRHIIYIKKL